MSNSFYLQHGFMNNEDLLKNMKINSNRFETITSDRIYLQWNNKKLDLCRKYNPFSFEKDLNVRGKLLLVQNFDLTSHKVLLLSCFPLFCFSIRRLSIIFRKFLFLIKVRSYKGTS